MGWGGDVEKRMEVEEKAFLTQHNTTTIEKTTHTAG